jgi:dienelactone hydrolase
MVKHFVPVTILFLSITSYSQTSLKSHTVSGALDQYMWSFSKNNAASKKPLVDFEAIENWRGMGSYLAISDNGKYFAYTINKPKINAFFPGIDSLVVQSTHGSWRMSFPVEESGFFSSDGKQYIFKNGESLCFLQLGGTQQKLVRNIASFKCSRNKWLAYQLKDKDFLILQDLVTGKETSFAGVTDYNFDNLGEWLIFKRANDLYLYNLVTGAQKYFPFVVEYALAGNGKAALLKTVEKNDNGVTTALKYLGAPDWNEKIIWSGNKEKTDIGSYAIDNSGRQVVFSQGSADTRIWYYNADRNIATVSATNTTAGFSEELRIKGDVSFSDNGRYIRISLQPSPDTRKPDPDMAHVEVWGHKDLFLQSAQSEQSKQSKTYTALINIENGKVMPLENNGKKLYLIQGDFAVVKKDPIDEYGERFWEVRNSRNKDSNWIVSLKDGSSHLLPTTAGNENFWFSPGGKYLVYFDMDKGGHYFSYDLHTGEVKDIAVNVPENQLALSNRYTGNKIEFGNLAGWLENDAGILVYDDYDIWKLDLTGKEPATNVTNMFGRSNGIMFNMLTNSRFYGEIPVLKTKEPLLVRAFNTRNKESGFFRKANLNAGSPKRLYMGRYFMNLIWGCHDGNVSNDGLAPVRAKGRETWIVQRQSATDAPNYYETNDFSNFKRLTNFQPQQHLRWLSEELHAYKHLDGRDGQGILYKPDDFDSTKKYPVLILFYGAFSNSLNQFHVPIYIDQAMAPGKSPVWFVNNGYLVFTPDIYTTPLKHGPRAFSVIEGAVQYLKQLSYVDGRKLGYAAHSWSAHFGAYLLTHSRSFSATAMSEGFLYGNAISNSFYIRGDGLSRLPDVENEMEYGNLWENKESWLDQTTVLQADKAKIPLLLFCNRQSSRGDQDQTQQLYTALRRLEKNVWWLKYDNGGHVLQDLNELKDYTIRYTQFFDHYLKEAPAPLWMTQGIPYKLKGIESRYELDPQGACNSNNGESCLICRAWNEQYKKTPAMFQQEIKNWVLDKDAADELERKQNERRKQLDNEGEKQTREIMKMLNAGK